MWHLSYVVNGFDLERPRLDLVFEQKRMKNLFFPQEKKGISVRFTIGDSVSMVVQELRRVADELERDIK